MWRRNVQKLRIVALGALITISLILAPAARSQVLKQMYLSSDGHVLGSAFVQNSSYVWYFALGGDNSKFEAYKSSLLILPGSSGDATVLSGKTLVTNSGREWKHFYTLNDDGYYSKNGLIEASRHNDYFGVVDFGGSVIALCSEATDIGFWDFRHLSSRQHLRMWSLRDWSVVGSTKVSLTRTPANFPALLANLGENRFVVLESESITDIPTFFVTMYSLSPLKRLGEYQLFEKPIDVCFSPTRNEIIVLTKSQNTASIHVLSTDSLTNEHSIPSRTGSTTFDSNDSARLNATYIRCCVGETSEEAQSTSMASTVVEDMREVLPKVGFVRFDFALKMLAIGTTDGDVIVYDLSEEKPARLFDENIFALILEQERQPLEIESRTEASNE